MFMDETNVVGEIIIYYPDSYGVWYKKTVKAKDSRKTA